MSDLELKAANASSLLAPAELHGMVCGFGVTREGGFPLNEFVELAGADSLTDEGSVRQFIDAALEDLVDDDLAFAPIVPDDDEALSLRVGAVADFCAGFLSGFAAGVERARDDLPAMLSAAMTAMRSRPTTLPAVRMSAICLSR